MRLNTKNCKGNKKKQRLTPLQKAFSNYFLKKTGYKLRFTFVSKL